MEVINHAVVVATVEAVEMTEAEKVEVRLTLHDSSTLTLIMDASTLNNLADQVSQYATP